MVKNLIAYFLILAHDAFRIYFQKNVNATQGP